MPHVMIYIIHGKFTVLFKLYSYEEFANGIGVYIKNKSESSTLKH